MSQTTVHGHNLTVTKKFYFRKDTEILDRSPVSVHFHYLANKREGNIYDSNVCYNITASE